MSYETNLMDQTKTQVQVPVRYPTLLKSNNYRYEKETTFCLVICSDYKDICRIPYPAPFLFETITMNNNLLYTKKQTLNQSRYLLLLINKIPGSLFICFAGFASVSWRQNFPLILKKVSKNIFKIDLLHFLSSYLLTRGTQ
jgi:hypothetical protein